MRLATIIVLLTAINPLMAWQATAPQPDILDVIKEFEVEDCSILEVSKEMFEILAADERNDEDMKKTLSQINHLVYLDCFPTHSNKDREVPNLADKFRARADFINFKLLMRSQDSMTTNLFYRRKAGDFNEYILVTEITFQYISTKLNIMSIRDLKDIIDMAGSAGDL